MEKSKETTELYAALVSFQGEVPVILKENMVKDKYGKDKYTYADMADVKNTIQGHMKKNGLGAIQSMDYENDYVHVVTEIIHCSGQWIRSKISAQVSVNIGYMSQIQAIGSVSTYLKRYALSSMLGLVTDQDRDGNVDQDAQRQLEAKEQKEKQADMVKQINDLKTEAQLVLQEINDQEFVREVNEYLKRNCSIETMQKVVARVNARFDEQIQYKTRD